MKIAAAWLVHLYTALGLVCAAWIAVLIVHGGDSNFRSCFLLMLIATLIDATDGRLARAANVERRTPGFDGRRLDDLIDFQTYTTLPLLLLWRAGILPPGWDWAYLPPLLASAYGFSQVKAKTEDDYFLGFPSYWNITAFYLYMLSAPPWFNIAVLLGLAALTFVPSLYLYPTKGATLRVPTNVLAGIWCVSLLWILIQWRTFPPAVLWTSLLFPAYYFVASWVVTIHKWRGRL